MTGDPVPGGTFLLNCGWDLEELEARLPAKTKRDIAQKGIRFYTVDGTRIAKELGLGNRINMILQAAFFKLAKIIPLSDAVKYMKEAVVESYGRKGEKVVAMNHAAIDRGLSELKKVNVPKEWARQRMS